MSKLTITKKRVDGGYTFFSLKWQDTDIGLDEWTEAHSQSWRKFAAIIPAAIGRAVELMDNDYESMSEDHDIRVIQNLTHSPAWPEKNQPPWITASIRAGTVDEERAMQAIERAVVDVIEMYENPVRPEAP